MIEGGVGGVDMDEEMMGNTDMYCECCNWGFQNLIYCFQVFI
jgi:hypothetical protein